MKNKKKIRRRIYLLLLFLLIVFYKNYVFVDISFYHIEKNYVVSTLSKYDLSNVNNLMIVAHPDDDMLWGGANLIQDNYLVVCVTCGVVKERTLEFDSVMQEVNDPYIILKYPDLTNGKRDDWSTVYDDITKDLKTIIEYKDWKKIVTHNPEGEYGHQHHIMTSEIVTNEIVTNLSDKENLYYFAKYYSKDKLNNLNYCLPEISSELLERKNEILKLYISQEKVIDGLEHMVGHEFLIKYKNWKYDK